MKNSPKKAKNWRKKGNEQTPDREKAKETRRRFGTNKLVRIIIHLIYRWKFRESRIFFFCLENKQRKIRRLDKKSKERKK